LAGVLLLDHPVENEIIFVSHAIEEILEEFAEIANVGFLFEFKTAAVVHVNSELLGVSFGQGLNGSRELLVPDLLILFLLCLSRETLPWEAASAEVHKDKAEGF
jgi:hypothetical protein